MFSLRRMNGRSVLKTIPLRVTVLPGLAPKIRFVLFALFLIQFTMVWWNLWSPFPGFGNARWPNGLLLMLTAATVLASLTCQLPLQNVMFASVIIAAVAGAVQPRGEMTAFLFGPYFNMDRLGRVLSEPLPLPW